MARSCVNLFDEATITNAVRQEVNGESLARFNHGNLEAGLGISNFNKREDLLRAIASLKGDTNG